MMGTMQSILDRYKVYTTRDGKERNKKRTRKKKNDYDGDYAVKKDQIWERQGGRETSIGLFITLGGFASTSEPIQ